MGVNNRILGLVSLLVGITGLFFIARWRNRRKVTVVLYHDPSPEVFVKHLLVYKRWFTLITLDDLVNAKNQGTWDQLPPYSLVVTFDDGHLGNRALLPLFVEYNLKPTIYLCSGIVCTLRHFWFKEVGIDVNALKTVPNSVRLTSLAEKNGFSQTKAFEDRQALSEEDLREMKGSVDLQGHTRFHPILPTCTPVELAEELGGSRFDLETLLDGPFRHFAYPNGDYNDDVVKALVDAGYSSGRTVDMGWNGPDMDVFRIKSISIKDFATPLELMGQLTGLPDRLYGWFKRLK